MIAFDTNLLLRLLLNDDPRQSRQAQAIVGRAVDLGESVLLPDIVLCEVEWVLSSTYNLSRARIAQTVRRLLEGTEFTFVNRAAVNAALDSYACGKAEFSDYLIGATAKAAGATTTYTFDRDLRSGNDFTIVQG